MVFYAQVIFCTKPGRSGYRFRAPLEADFLGSYARQRHLFPKFEIKLEDLDVGGEGETVLVESNVGLLEAWQKVSAVGHWGIIRTVVPAAVWENY